jgi:hypothetical protein
MKIKTTLFVILLGASVGCSRQPADVVIVNDSSGFSAGLKSEFERNPSCVGISIQTASKMPPHDYVTWATAAHPQIWWFEPVRDSSPAGYYWDILLMKADGVVPIRFPGGTSLAEMASSTCSAVKREKQNK